MCVHASLKLDSAIRGECGFWEWLKLAVARSLARFLSLSVTHTLTAQAQASASTLKMNKSFQRVE